MVFPFMVSCTCTGPHWVEATAPVRVVVPAEPAEPEPEPEPELELEPEELDVPEEAGVPVVPVDTTALGELAELAAWAPVVEVW
jgi:hypothetical protein